MHYLINDICSKVFATVKQGPYPRKKGTKCLLSGEPIAHGDPVYIIKLISYSDGEMFFVRADKAEESPEFMQNLDHFEHRMYPCSFMFYENCEKMEPFDPDWANKEWNIQRLTNAIEMTQSEDSGSNYGRNWRSWGPGSLPCPAKSCWKDFSTGSGSSRPGHARWISEKRNGCGKLLGLC